MIAAIKGFAVVQKLLVLIPVIGPIGAFLSPIFAALAEGAAEIVRQFFKGVAAVFANPATLLVILSGMGGAYVYATGIEKVKTEKAEKAVIIMRSEVDKKCPESTARTIRRHAGVKPAPAAKTVLDEIKKIPWLN